MSSFTVEPTPIPGLMVLQRLLRRDSRGYLSRLFCSHELYAAGWTKPVAQVNHTLTSHRGTVRGLHFQLPPHTEAKLVTCIRGAVWDVAVDLRAGSPTFLLSHAELLSADNHRTLLIPEGMAHGFQALANDSELVYLHSAHYAPHAEGGLNVRDPRLAIAWPEPIVDVSARDAGHPMVPTNYPGLKL